MKRFPLAAAAAVIGACVVPTVASAQEVNLGVTATPVTAPTCPTGVSQADCKIVLTQMTALETVRDGDNYPTTVKAPGELVSFTVGISAISSDPSTVKTDVSGLDSAYGGPPQAAVTVLKPIGQHGNFRWEVAAESSVVKLQSYLGKVVEFPLAQSLPVVPGEVIALTVPTWAPILTFELTPSKFAYRQSRSTNCLNTSSTVPINPQLTIGEQTKYSCDYPGTRVEYSADEVLTPTATTNVRRETPRRPVIIRR
jgi:hypothetical protein